MRKKILASLVAVSALALALLMLAACSQPEVSRESSESMQIEESEPAIEISTEPFYVMIVGNDSREGTVQIKKEAYADGTGRSDTLMLARVDAGAHQITLVTIPRDTEDSIDGTPVKINERFRAGGIEGLTDAVADLTGVRPKYYLETTFVNFEKLIDKLGGLTVYVPYDQSMSDVVSGKKISYSAGEQTLDGAEALVFARERKKYNSLNPVGGEPLRQSNDRLIVQTIITQVLSDAETAPDVARALFGFCESNWDEEEFIAYVKDFAENAKEVTFLSGTGPYDGYTNDIAGWVAYRDTDVWAQVMEVVNAGGDPNTVLEAPTLY